MTCEQRFPYEVHVGISPRVLNCGIASYCTTRGRTPAWTNFQVSMKRTIRECPLPLVASRAHRTPAPTLRSYASYPKRMESIAEAMRRL